MNHVFRHVKIFFSILGVRSEVSKEYEPVYTRSPMDSGHLESVCVSFEDVIHDFDDIPFEADSDDERTTEDTSPRSVTDFLLSFFIMFNVSHRAMQVLLSGLSKFYSDVPPTLHRLRKASSVDVQNYDIDNNICYLSITDNIEFFIRKGLLPSNVPLNLNLKINVDGLPLFHSSKVNLWPILMCVKEVTANVKPVPVAVFCGIGKPPLEVFLRKFCDELRLMKTGTLISDQLVKLSSVVFVCDAPARAYLQGIVSHNGFSGCGYCDIKGEYHENRVVFDFQEGCEQRSDEGYSLGQENNQIRTSPLTAIVPLKSSFPPEYMHCVCLGIMKKLLYFFAPERRSVLK